MAQDVNIAEEAGLAGTPTYFINEVVYRGSLDRDSLADVLGRVVTVADGRSRERERRAADE